MTRTEIAHELRSVRRELDWLLWCETLHNPDWRFGSSRYSKRRVRLVRTFWALKGMQKTPLYLYFRICGYPSIKEF